MKMKLNFVWVFLVLIVFHTYCSGDDQTSVKQAIQVAPVFEIYDDSVQALLENQPALEVLADGLGWPEGPLWVEELNSLLFSDIEQNKIYRWQNEEGLSVYVSPSGHNPDGVNASWRGSNALLVNNGELIIASQGGRTLMKMNAPLNSPKPAYSHIVERFQGKKLNSPNDLLMDSAGNIYFTDPPYGLDGFETSPALELDFFGVYRLTTTGMLELLVHDLKKPNGIALDEKGRKLLVSDSHPGKSQIMIYDLKDDGGVRNGKLFFDAVAYEKQGPGSTDGLEIHSSGMIFATMPNGVGILNWDGKLLAYLAMGQVTNVAFNPDESMLFITGPEHLYRMQLK